MTAEIKIDRSPTDNVWGHTTVGGCFSRSNYFGLRVPGYAEVYSSDYAVVLVDRGAAFSRLWFNFAAETVASRPLHQSGIAGLVVADRKTYKTTTLRAAPGEQLSLVAGPVDLVVAADNGGTVREIYRVKLADVIAVKAEVPLPQELGQAVLDATSTSILLPAA